MDNYGYRPMIRPVFAHRVFRPAIGEPSDEAQISAGITASLPVLDALNALAGEGHVLTGRDFTLADCHLAPMIAYYVQAPEGADALTKYPALADWWAKAVRRKCIVTTDPGLPRSWD
ncbi:MAG: glutathione S-transferase domain-containing protein [Paracoccaceae bacterium]